MSIVSDLIGTELADALTPQQHETIREAVDEAPDGLRRVADEIRSAGNNIERPVAVLLNRVRRGQHLDRQRTTGPRRNTSPTDSRVLAQQLYAKKIADLHQHDLDWTEAEQRQFAIDYALDHCRASGEALWAIERELHAEHGLHLTGQERDFERDTPHRRLMHATHGRHAAPAGVDEIPGEPA